MSTAKVIQIIANSPTSFDAALEQGVADAAKSVHGICGVKITDWTVDVEDSKINNYKVTLEVAFKVDQTS